MCLCVFPAAQCDEPPSVVNAEWSGPRDGTFPYRTVVTYQCLKGQLIGKSEIYCTHNGMWSANGPMCQGTPPPPHPETGTDGACTHSPWGYSISLNFMSLIDITCSNPMVSNGEKTSGFHMIYEYRDSVSFQCHKGYVLSGNRTVTCSAKGQWKPALPTCKGGYLSGYACVYVCVCVFVLYALDC